MAGDLSLMQSAAILLAVAVGGAVQGTIGFGFAMISAPVVALVRPEALPATLLIMAFPLTLAMAMRERREIDLEGVAWIIGGRTLGTAGGLALLVAASRGSLDVLFGSMIVLAAVLGALRPAASLGQANRFVAGTLSGVMGTTTSIGGPPLALLYRGRSGSQIRSTLAVSFAAGLVISLGGLLIARQIRGWQTLLALQLLPALGLGLLASGRLAAFADRAFLRPAVLAFSGLAGLAALLRGLL